MRGFIAGPLVRVIPVGLCFLGLQRRVFDTYTISGVAVQVVLALVVAAGASSGSERGALVGFVLGLMYDLGVGTPLGSTALAYGLAGMVAGYVISITPDPQWWLACLFAAVGAAVGEAMVPVVRLLIGDDGWVNPDLLKVIPIVTVTSALLCPLLVPLGRWCSAVKRPKWKAIPE